MNELGLTVAETILIITNERELHTAAELADHHALDGVSLATVSSVLCRLVKMGKMLRLKGWGPRGGYGYVRARE